MPVVLYQLYAISTHFSPSLNVKEFTDLPSAEVIVRLVTTSILSNDGQPFSLLFPSLVRCIPFHFQIVEALILREPAALTENTQMTHAAFYSTLT